MSTRFALETRGLDKRFGGLHATRGVSLAITAGTVHAVIGPNGAGKTTLISLLSGLLPADAGEILLFGQRIDGLSQAGRVAAGLARSFQISSVFAELTVRQNLIVAVQRAARPGFGFLQRVAADAELRDAADAIAQRVGLADALEVPAVSLSHGRRKRLDVGLAIACRPRVLLMDEPMAGMGHEESAEMIDLIRSLVPATTVLLVEHDMEAVFSLADEITVLVQGGILSSGSPDAIRDDAAVRAAYLGEEEVPVTSREPGGVR
jgi:branched-chain amino acid transport system ATP-binding protein